ncbi:MAG TPA: protein phosphatase 2C domain-containing protein [Candidatus Binatia bacterium]|nr:protein phosphatase 2C domain-containing protein [Candidatus Binatia bacterium]
MRVDLQHSAWKATRQDKGPMQDIVLLAEFEKGKLLVVADGATGANGLAAIEIIKNAFDQYCAESEPANAEEMKHAFVSIIKTAQTSMIERSKEIGRIAASVTCTILCTAEPDPKVLLCRLGDSGFVFTHETQDSLPYPVSRGSDFGLTTWVSSYEKLDPPKWSEHALVSHGVYRVRLFSDGIHLQFNLNTGENNEQYTEEILIGNPKGIHDLIREISEEWSERQDNIWVGMDDISIAGFDVVLP